MLCIALAELPALLPPAEVAEALLHVTNGPTLIARMVANQPDCFREGQQTSGLCDRIRNITLNVLVFFFMVIEIFLSLFGFKTCYFILYVLIFFHFCAVVTGLVMSGDKQDEDTPGGLLRLQAVRTLCQMNPSQALNVRALCVS